MTPETAGSCSVKSSSSIKNDSSGAWLKQALHGCLHRHHDSNRLTPACLFLRYLFSHTVDIFEILATCDSLLNVIQISFTLAWLNDIAGTFGEACSKSAPCSDLLPTTPRCDYGVCTASGMNSSCVCIEGFQGANCSLEIDMCTRSPCRAGSCLKGFNSFSCVCPEDYDGDFCEVNYYPSVHLR